MAYEFNPFYITKNATEEALAEAVEKVYKWCKDRIRWVIDLYFKSIDSPYNYLIREYPILVDDELPPAYVAALINAESPAMFTGDYVAVSTKLVAKTVIEGALIRAEKVAMVGISGSGLIDEILTIIAHEYTHALYNHGVLRQRFHKKTKGKDDKTFMLACEIQANRGVYVNKTSLVYELGVTEEKFIKDVPDIATAKTLDNIYIALKNVYKDKIDNNNNENKENNKDENQSNRQKQQSESGSEGEENKQNQGDRQQSKQQSGNQGEENEAGKELNSEQQKALDRLFKQEEKKGTSSGFLHDYSEDEVEDDSEKDARTLLNEYNQRVETAKIKKSLLKLRAVLKGDLSKGKVPTYSRPSRKSSADSGLFKKGKKNDARFNPSILLALDSSGSMSSTTIKQVTEATVDIVKALGRDISNCYICLHDGKVYNLQKLKDYEEVLKTYRPSGGNNFLRVYQKAVELNCDVVLNVGDGLDSIEDWAYCFRKDGNDKTGKGLLKTNKKLTWYDCLVYKLDDDATKWYYQENYKDEKLGGVKRKTLDLVGSLRPKEDFTEKIEESLKNEIERRNR